MNLIDPYLIRRLQAENKRLRGALKKMAKDPPSTLDEPDMDWEVIHKMREIARRALALSSKDQP